MKLAPGSLSTWRNRPTAIILVVGALVIAGIGAIAQNESAYRQLKTQETRVQAEVLAASVTAALDFEDRTAAQQAVDALRVNRQVQIVGVYAEGGRLLAGFARPGRRLPTILDTPQYWASNSVPSLVPVMSGGERIGSVLISVNPEPLARRLTRYAILALLVSLAALVIIVLGVAQNALRRANNLLASRANALAEANAELKVQIAERAKAEDRSRQSQKLQALGQLTGGIAHDFNNLLTVIQGSADMLRRPNIPEPKRLRYAEAVVQAANRAAALTGQLLAFARRQPLQPEVIDVNELIRGMTDLLDRTLGERIAVRTELAAAPCPVEADRAQLESALLNVAVNARDAMPDGGTLEIATSIDGESDNPMVTVKVSDTGTGMDEDTLSRAIEPFFTTKVAGKGTGLGLSQVYGFANQSGGDVRIESEVGQGTSVILRLPLSALGLQQPKAALPVWDENGRRGRILIVEDNEEVGEFAEALLRELGHRVTRVLSGRQALDILEEREFDAVFSDVVMPGMNGLELAEAISKRRPDLPIILTTGYSDEIAETGTGGRPIILKPYRLETLAAALDRALGAAEGRR